MEKAYLFLCRRRCNTSCQYYTYIFAYRPVRTWTLFIPILSRLGGKTCYVHCDIFPMGNLDRVLCLQETETADEWCPKCKLTFVFFHAKVHTYIRTLQRVRLNIRWLAKIIKHWRCKQIANTYYTKHCNFSDCRRFPESFVAQIERKCYLELSEIKHSYIK